MVRVISYTIHMCTRVIRAWVIIEPVYAPVSISVCITLEIWLPLNCHHIKWGLRQIFPRQDYMITTKVMLLSTLTRQSNYSLQCSLGRDIALKSTIRRSYFEGQLCTQMHISFPFSHTPSHCGTNCLNCAVMYFVKCFLLSLNV